MSDCHEGTGKTSITDNCWNCLSLILSICGAIIVIGGGMILALGKTVYETKSTVAKIDERTMHIQAQMIDMNNKLDKMAYSSANLARYNPNTNHNIEQIETFNPYSRKLDNNILD